MPPRDVDKDALQKSCRINGKQEEHQTKKWVKKPEAEDPGMLSAASTGELQRSLSSAGKGSTKKVSPKTGKQGRANRQKTHQHESRDQSEVLKEGLQPAARRKDSALEAESNPELEPAPADDTQTTATVNSQDGLNCEDSTSALPEDMSAAASEDFAAKDADDIADRLFRNLYSRKITVPDIVAYMRQSKISNDCKMQKVYHVMVTCLLDEIQHFPSWPQQELDLTAELMGQLLCWNLLPEGAPVRTALVCIICALHEPDGSPMRRFGLSALEQFKSRLHGSSLATLHAAMSRQIAQQVSEKQQHDLAQANNFKQQLELARLRKEQLEHQQLFLHLASLKQHQTLLQQGPPTVQMPVRQAPPGSWTRSSAQGACAATQNASAANFSMLARQAGNWQMPVQPAAVSAGYPAAGGGPLRPGALQASHCQGPGSRLLPGSAGSAHAKASRQGVIQSGLQGLSFGNGSDASSSRWREEDKLEEKPRREQAKSGKTKRNSNAAKDEKAMTSRQSRHQRPKSLNRGFVEVDEESMVVHLQTDDIEDHPLQSSLTRDSSNDSLMGLESYLYGTADS